MYSITISGGIRALLAYAIGQQTGSEAMLVGNLIRQTICLYLLENSPLYFGKYIKTYFVIVFKLADDVNFIS